MTPLASSPELRYRRADHLAWVGTSRVVIVDLSRMRAAPLALEGSAAWVWQQLCNRPSATELADRASRVFRVPGEEILADIEAFLAVMTDSWLVIAERE